MDLDNNFFSKNSSIVFSVPEIKTYSSSEKEDLIRSICDMAETIIIESGGRIAVFRVNDKEKMIDFLEEGGDS